jgi:hypothetical protein
MKFRYEWAWDDVKNQLYVHVLGFNPLKGVANEEGQVLYKTPLFYYRFDD